MAGVVPTVSGDHICNGVALQLHTSFLCSYHAKAHLVQFSPTQVTVRFSCYATRGICLYVVFNAFGCRSLCRCATRGSCRSVSFYTLAAWTSTKSSPTARASFPTIARSRRSTRLPCLACPRQEIDAKTDSPALAASCLTNHLAVDKMF